jgi:hypothetical protein
MSVNYITLFLHLLLAYLREDPSYAKLSHYLRGGMKDYIRLLLSSPY